jgi:4-hydroxythreonine-4-phosphate dehydrogenase
MRRFSRHPAAIHPEGDTSLSGILVTNAGFPAPPVRPGTLDAAASLCAVEWFRHAVRLVIEGKADAVVTGPITKEGIHAAGYGYLGHTEIIAELTGHPDFRMCLFTDTMRIVHNSSHCSLAESLESVRAERIAQTIRIGHDGLRSLGIEHGRIAVAGLNPHAGEGGMLGREEIDEIEPAIRRCQSEGVYCSGPHSPDTVFRRAHLGEFDMVIAMYHDQGHAPAKLIAMDTGVSLTLGIPLIRTSVDHGTAFDIAWQGKAQATSMLSAMRLAVEMAGRQAEARL